MYHFTGMKYNKQSGWETLYERVLWKLIYLISNLEEVKNANW